LIIARTDAIAVEGFEPALARGRAYAEAGADLLFVEAPRSVAEMRQIVAALGGRVPLMANMVEGGQSPLRTAGDLEALGFSLVIFPGGIVRALAKTAAGYYRSLHDNGTNAPFAEQMYDFGELNDLLGTADILARGKAYDDLGDAP
jgi:2-methylisocitrate lyase-like PEP mutase family enzyme